MNRCIPLLAAFSLVAAGSPSPAQNSPLAVLHSFAGYPTDGDTPQGVVVSGGTLYGTCGGGGAGNIGTVFSIGTDGTGYAALHSFVGTDPYAGSYPCGCRARRLDPLRRHDVGRGRPERQHLQRRNQRRRLYQPLLVQLDRLRRLSSNREGSLAVAGSTIYGATSGGGPDDCGTIYKLATNGSGFDVLHSFDGTDAPRPQAAWCWPVPRSTERPLGASTAAGRSTAAPSLR